MKLFLRVSTWRQAIDEFICNFLILHMYSYVFHFSMIHGCINVLCIHVCIIYLFDVFCIVQDKLFMFDYFHFGSSSCHGVPDC